MIRSHKWEWGPPTPQHHPALQCPHYIMHLQTQLTLRNLIAPSQLTSLHRSPYKTAATPWTTDFAASFLNPVIHFLLCQQCQGKDVLCTNGRCLSQTSLSHLKALSRSTTTQCMNTAPWLVVRPAKASLLLWWLNRNPEILHMIQKCLAATPFIWGKKASWLIPAEQKAVCLKRGPGSFMMTPVLSQRNSMGTSNKSQECIGKDPHTSGGGPFSSGSFWWLFWMTLQTRISLPGLGGAWNLNWLSLKRWPGVGAFRRTGQLWTMINLAVPFAIIMRKESCKRWLERDMSTNLFVIQKPSSPWPFQIISAHCWRQTWSVTSMKRTRCLCLTLTRAWPTCQKGAAATPTPTMKVMCINTSDSQAGPSRFFLFARCRESLNSLQSLIFVVCILFLNNNTQKGAFPVALFYGLYGLCTLFEGGWE